MVWPTNCRDLAVVDALRDAVLALPEWAALDPLADAVSVLDWPVTTIAGPRMLIMAPLAANESAAQHARQIAYEVSCEIHVPVDAREALAAVASLRDGIAALELTGIRVLSAKVTEFERGKYVSSSAASSTGGAVDESTSTPDAPSPSWSRSTSVAHRALIVLRLLNVPYVY